MKKLTNYDFFLLSTLFFFILISFLIESNYSVLTFAFANLSVLICYYFSNNIRLRYNDNSFDKIRITLYFKVVISTFLLIFGWIPELKDINGVNFGYDPQRFYYNSKDLLSNNWDPDFLEINYIGVIYYYAFLFKIFGISPIVAFFSNFFLRK